jgi:hypothetical protein
MQRRMYVNVARSMIFTIRMPHNASQWSSYVLLASRTCISQVKLVCLHLLLLCAVWIDSADSSCSERSYWLRSRSFGGRCQQKHDDKCTWHNSFGQSPFGECTILLFYILFWPFFAEFRTDGQLLCVPLPKVTPSVCSFFSRAGRIWTQRTRFVFGDVCRSLLFPHDNDQFVISLFLYWLSHLLINLWYHGFYWLSHLIVCRFIEF